MCLSVQKTAVRSLTTRTITRSIGERQCRQWQRPVVGDSCIPAAVLRVHHRKVGHEEEDFAQTAVGQLRDINFCSLHTRRRYSEVE